MKLGLGLVTTSLLVLALVADGLSSPSSTTPKNILYDFPVSNNGGRCRIIVYKVCIKEGVHVSSLTILRDPVFYLVGYG